MPDAIRRATEELHIEPMVRVNYVPRYAEQDIDRIAAHIKRPVPSIQ